MLGDASAVVLAKVSAVEEKDGAKLRTYRLDVQRVLRGDLKPKKVALVQILGDAQPSADAQAYVEAGKRIIVLLAAPPSDGNLKKQLADGAYFDVVDGRDGVIVMSDNGDIAAVERVIKIAATIGPATGPRSDGQRVDLALLELASGHPRLAADALAEMQRAGSLRWLSRVEAKAVGKALANQRIDPSIRASLVDTLGAKRARNLHPVLVALKPNQPQVLAAALRARAVLGQAADDDEVGRYLASNDPAIRAAAVEGLALLKLADTTERLGGLATKDKSELVRIAAIESLGESKDPEALKWLSRCFDSDARAVRQASGRAVIAIGGAEADKALVALALKGKSPTSRTYAATLLMTKYPREHPVIAELEAGKPGADVRELIEHGFKPAGTDRR